MNNELNVKFNARHRPTIICLCGSTRFTHAFQLQNLQLTLRGYIVLSVGTDKKADELLGITEDQKVRLDELHLRKIDLSDMIMVLNVDGYVGESTKNEITYALKNDKGVRWLEDYVSVPALDADPSFGRTNISIDDYVKYYILQEVQEVERSG